MTAAAIALSSQDILHHILSLDLLTQSDLHSCCLVNSEWAATGLVLLWRYPQCHSLYSFRLLLDTLRHEADQPGPVATESPATASIPISLASSLRRSATMHDRTVSTSKISKTTTSLSSLSLVPTLYQPYRQRKEYGIPFHGQRIYHRAQFIRRIDFSILANTLSNHHLEILARSSKIGFRSLDIQASHLSFTNHLLCILANSKALRQLTLGSMHVPLDALLCLEPCFSALTQLHLLDCPDSMGDLELSTILRHCHQLRSLEIHGDSFTDESLGWISKTCTDLEVLTIEAPKMTDTVVNQIAATCTRLRSWRLINCTALLEATTEGLQKMYSMNRTPSSSTSSSTISSPSTSSMSSHPDFEPLTTSSHPSDQIHPSLALDRYAYTLQQTAKHFGKLSTIEFRNCTGIQSQHINFFLKSQLWLEHLTLGGPSITDDALCFLTETPLTHLQSFSLIDCGEISDEAMVAIMFNCDQMKSLTIFGSQFTLRTFSSISLHLNQLEELHLERVPLVMNESLQDILIKCTELRILKLWHCRNLTKDIFTEQLVPCANLEQLEYMDKFPRPYAEDGWEAQVRFLQSLVIRFERLQALRLAKLADTWVPVNLVSYLCQLDRLEKFTILQNHSLELIDLKELKARLPTLVHVGVGLSNNLSEEDLVGFAQYNHRPGIRIYHRMLESSTEL
ncbi:hypothetical protein BX616_006911 [Lobosporangium transversale]|nr:hypothetical protein BX616_006911 [Lobosporangium transversale]